MPKLIYVFEYVGDMKRAVAFYRDVVGLSLKFESPEWSEFTTGDTTFALHPASERNPAGKVEVGFRVENLQAFYDAATAKGIRFPLPPKKQDYGGTLAQFEDSEGAAVSVSAE